MDQKSRNRITGNWTP